jgi:hypothetical protein
MRNIIITILFIAAFILGANTASAQCSCVNDRFSVYDEFKYSDAVFVGKVVDVKKIEGSKNTDKTTNTDYYEFQVRFKIKKAWKNDLTETITITNTDDDSSHFEIDESYLVYAKVRYDDGVLRAHTGCCTRTKRLSEATKELQEFEANGEKPTRIIKKSASN